MVFDRCDPNVMAVVDRAMEEATALGHDRLGTEHLLLALVEHRGLLPARVAELLPEDPEVLRSEIVSKMGALRRPDAELLKVVGVDLAEVRAAVRQAFGDEALADLPTGRQRARWRPRRRSFRRCTSLLAGTTNVAPRVKESLMRARGHADRQQRSTVDPAALLLGMVDVESAMANTLLRQAGVEPDHIRRVLN